MSCRQAYVTSICLKPISSKKKKLCCKEIMGENENKKMWQLLAAKDASYLTVRSLFVCACVCACGTHALRLPFYWSYTSIANHSCWSYVSIANQAVWREKGWWGWGWLLLPWWPIQGLNALMSFPLRKLLVVFVRVLFSGHSYQCIPAFLPLNIFVMFLEK